MNIPAQVVGTRDANSYDFVRFCAASCVLFSHHFDLAGFAEPVVPGLGEDFGELGVEIFFCLSGFLIYLSLQRSRSWVRFAAARVLRIFPNLLFVLLVSSVATFVWYRNEPHAGDHVTYVIDNLLMFFDGVTFEIPGIFTDAVRQSVNDPLWTLPYELWLYVLLALLFLAGARAPILTLIAAAVIGFAYARADIDDFDIGRFESYEFLRLGSYFLAGAVIAVVWPRIKSHAIAFGAAGLVALFILGQLLPQDTILDALALALAVIGLGSSRAMAWFAKGGDASYGMYIFAWPVQQFALLLIAPFWLSLAAAFAVTAAIGYATWHTFENRLMAYPDRVARYAYRVSV
ncbi:MAG: acyltransferase, partial [Pseudolabrys sp.]|nr:acyltransferase [Pseudolabrys sp.]